MYHLILILILILTYFVSAHFNNSLEHASGQVYYEGELLLTQRPECRRKTEDRR